MVAKLIKKIYIERQKNMTNNSLNLTKGGRINLSKDRTGLNYIRVGLGWEANHASGNEFDLDVTAFALKHVDGEPILYTPEWMVFYNNTSSPNGAIKHTGDNKTGGNNGDDEEIIVTLDGIPKEVVEISFITTIHKAVERKQNFGQINNSYIAVYNQDNNELLARYDLEDSYSLETALQFGSLVRKGEEWIFKAVGAGFQCGLSEFVRGYGADC